MVLRNLNQGLGHADDEGVGLALGLAMIIAKNLLEALRPYQVGERGNYFAILGQDGSRQAQMFAAWGVYLLVGYEQAALPRDAEALEWISGQLLDALDSGRFASVPEGD